MKKHHFLRSGINIILRGTSLLKCLRIDVTGATLLNQQIRHLAAKIWGMPIIKYSFVLSYTIFSSGLISVFILPSHIYASSETQSIVDRIYREDIALRTESSKTFFTGLNPDGSGRFETITYTDRIHYQSNDEWLEVDNKILYDVHDEFSYRNTANDFIFRAGDNLAAGVEFIRKDETCKFKLDSISGVSLQNSKAQIEETKVIYPDIYPDADLEFNITSLGVSTEIVVKDTTALQDKIIFELSDCDFSSFEQAMMNDDDTDAEVAQKIVHTNGKKTLVLEPDYDKLDDIKGEVRIDPSITVPSPMQDVFVSSSTRYGNRRMLIVGKYTDYTVPGNPTLYNSRSLMKFSMSIPSNATIHSASLKFYHYGSNAGTNIVVSRIGSAWNEGTFYPGPSYEGNYGSAYIPVWNTNHSNNIKERTVGLHTSLISKMMASNNGLLLRPAYNPNDRGFVFCSRNSDGFCQDRHDPKLVINYSVNQPPNPPNIDRPKQGWELGANESYSSVTCDKAGLGKGCDINFRLQTEDPDNSFPLNTTVRVRNTQGSNQDFSIYQSGEGWTEKTKHLNDGRWSWKAQTRDSHNLWSRWSVSKTFIVDTTAPSRPDMKNEPDYTADLQNNIYSNVSSDNLIGGVRYNFEISEKDDFSSIKESSGWIETNEFTFGSLEDNHLYYYRARAKDKLENISSWGTSTQSMQDDRAPEIVDIDLDPVRISPANQDQKYDSAMLSFSTIETNWKSNTVDIVNTGNQIVKTYKDLEQTANLAIDGKDNNGNWLEDGFYKVRITAEDLAGHKTTNDDTVLVIDNTAAEISISFPENGAWFNSDNTNISGITEPEAYLEIGNLVNEEFEQAQLDPQTGVFDHIVNIFTGENKIALRTLDLLHNLNEKQVTVYKENTSPEIISITPDAPVQSRDLAISLELEDMGAEIENIDFISGIDPDKTYLAILDHSGKEIVLVNSGLNVSPLGHIQHDCSEQGEHGLSNTAECTYEYIFDNEMQPDGQYQIDTKIYDIAGNETLSSDKSFEIDTHTFIEVVSPAESSLFNHSKIQLEGRAEKYAVLEITGSADYRKISIDPSSNTDSVTIDNCTVTENADTDGIKKICTWKVADFTIDSDPDEDTTVTDTIDFTITDTAGNTETVNRTYLVNLYQVNLSMASEINYFSPNGDGRQDGINFTDLQTDAEVREWQVIISDARDQLVKELSGYGQPPANVYWDGRYKESNNWIPDGTYTYFLHITTTDEIEFETNPVEIYARTVLEDEVVITYPKNTTTTTKGVINVQGQAPCGTEVYICVNTIGLPLDCDFEYSSTVNEHGSFSHIVPLIRLADQAETRHFITARAIDQYGSQTPYSNKVEVIADTSDLFVNISILPALSGVNNAEDYQVIIDKLNNGEEVTQQDLDKLKTVVLRSTVTKNTERVVFSLADFTNLEELPSDIDYSHLGYINGENRTNLYQTYIDGTTPVVTCSQTQCTWDFHYPVPPVAGGTYEIEFQGRKGETIQNVYSPVIIDGTLPLAPIILDINKIIDGESSNTNMFKDKYYSNSEIIEIRGGADPDLLIQIHDNNDNLICEAVSNEIGLFSCRADLSDFYSKLETEVYELSLNVTASDGLNETESLENTILILDKVSPEIIQIDTSSQWQRSGDIADLSVITDEAVNKSYIITPENVKYEFSSYQDCKGGTAALIIHGLALEGRYPIEISISDIAGNRTATSFEYYIDNTSPDSSDIDTTDWGQWSGIEAKADLPAAGRLVPEYVIRGDTLYINGKAEKHSNIVIYAGNEKMEEKLVSADNCTREDEDLITPDGIIVKQGEYCNWDYAYQFEEEEGYVFTVKTYDRAGNESLISEDEVVYYDKTNPQKPEVYNAFSSSYNPIGEWQKDGEPINNLHAITKDLQVSLSGYGEALSDYEYWLTAPDNKETDYKFFQNPGNGSHEQTFDLGDKLDEGDCIEDIGGRRTGVCQDGLYTFKTRSTDAAGNNSDKLEFQIERDTVAPAKPAADEPYICDYYNICIDIEGEQGSYLAVNDNLREKLSQSPQTYRIVSDFTPATRYDFTMKLMDRAGNYSEPVMRTILTPAISGGRGDIDGATPDDPWAGRDGHEFEAVRFKTVIKPDGSYELQNVSIPAPKLSLAYTNWQDEVYIHGIGLPSHHEIRTMIERYFLTFNEAKKACDVGWKFDKTENSDERVCVEEKMGIDNWSSWAEDRKKDCWSLNLSCLARMNSEWRQRSITHLTKTVDHAMISFHNHTAEDQYIGHEWSSDNGQFKKDFTLDKEVKISDTVNTRMNIFGEFEFEGMKIDYRGINWQEAQKNEGLRSSYSNTLIVLESEFTEVLDHEGKVYEGKVLDVPYFNQYLEPDGSYAPSLQNEGSDGRLMCSAASSVMIADYYNKVPIAGYSGTPKHYMYQDQGQGIVKNQYIKSISVTPCHDGAFGITGSGVPKCKYGDIAGIRKYFTTRGLNDKKEMWNQYITMGGIHQSIDQGHPMLLSIGKPIGHVLVIVGYTTNGEYMVVEDPFQDVQHYGRNSNGSAKFSDTGHRALYKLKLPPSADTDGKGFEMNYTMEISP